MLRNFFAVFRSTEVLDDHPASAREPTSYRIQAFTLRWPRLNQASYKFATYTPHYATGASCDLDFRTPFCAIYSTSGNIFSSIHRHLSIEKSTTRWFPAFRDSVIGCTPAWQFAIFPDICTARSNGRTFVYHFGRNCPRRTQTVEIVESMNLSIIGLVSCQK